MLENPGKNTFKVCIEKDDHKLTEEKDYEDISHVNYWIDETGNPKYRIYMRNGEVLFLADNEDFHREYCPCGVNVINEVVKERYL